MLKRLVALVPDNDSRIRSLYGLSDKQFLDLLYAQHGLCSICQVAFSKRVRPVVDHCHGSGDVRGLLCHHCNTGLGLLGDNPQILKRAIKYLKGNQHGKETQRANAG